MHPMLLVTTFSILLGDAAVASDLSPPLEALAAEAERAGYPAAALRLKAREGLAKGVPSERVAAVLRDMIDLYARARDMLPEATPSELDAAAGALRAGASRGAVTALASLGPEVRESALRGLADLVLLDIDEVQAVRLVRSASRQGPLGLSGLASAAASLVRGGASPGEAARAVGMAVAQGRDPLASMPPQARGPGDRGASGGSTPPWAGPSGQGNSGNSGNAPRNGGPP